ncbi:MAG: penicillin-binding protein 2 [Fimbriimonas sp.]
MSVIHTPRKPELDVRVLVFPSVMFSLLGVLFFRLWYFQVVKAPELVERAEATRKTSVDKIAPRGLIFDRRGVPVASVRPQIVVTAKPAELKKHPEVLGKVAAILQVPIEKLERKVKDAQWRPYLYSPIFIGASIQAGTRIAECEDDLPGIGVETLPMRHYPDTKSFTHVLGYVWTPSAEDVKRIEDQDRKPADYVGKNGIERAYETELMGVPGSEEMEVDARRRPIRVAGRDNPIPGNQLFLTLDSRLQRKATELLGGKGYIGGVAAIDPKTGEVLCLVSSPVFDQSVFEGGISQADFDALQHDPRKPMINRALNSFYPPGSTFKIVTAVAALQAGKFSPYNTYYCAGGYGRKKLPKCLGHHGAISFNRAMAKSCNTYFCSLGAAAGEDALRTAALDMGLGQKPGLEIGGMRGVVPTREWIKLVAPKHRYVWYPGDTANFSIGQGYMSATPIQMANVAAMVANDGVRYRPHLVHAVKDAQTGQMRRVQPEVVKKIDASPEFWSGMKKALQDVVDNGTAETARVQGIAVAGKTGSAEHKKEQKTHGWFVGFAPANDPKIAICVMVEAAGHGGEVAAPLAGELIKLYLSSKAPVKPAAADSAASARRGSPSAR